MIATTVSIHLIDLTDDERQRLLSGGGFMVYQMPDGSYKPLAPVESTQVPFGVALGDAVERDDGYYEVTIAVKGVIHVNAPGNPYYCKPDASYNTDEVNGGSPHLNSNYGEVSPPEK